jgi:hypothetical protein
MGGEGGGGEVVEGLGLDGEGIESVGGWIG